MLPLLSLISFSVSTQPFQECFRLLYHSTNIYRIPLHVRLIGATCWVRFVHLQTVDLKTNASVMKVIMRVAAPRTFHWLGEKKHVDTLVKL